MSSDADAPGSPFAAALESLRARGSDRRDPVRFRFIEALAQRAAGQQGAARRLLEDRLTHLVAAFDADEGGRPSVEPARLAGEPDARPEATAPAAAPAASTSSVTMPATPSSAPRMAAAPVPRVAQPASVPASTAAGPLAQLVHEIAERSPLPSPGTRPAHTGTATSPRPVAAPASAPSAPPELKALSYFRSTWSRLSTEQRLAQSAAKLPENAGPLNSQHLVHQSLVLMRELSPGYLERFIAHVDALMWLDQLNGTAGK